MSIKSKRLSMGLTQEELAQKMGVQRTAVAMWETGKAYPRADVLIKLAKLFGCTVDGLLLEEAEEREQEGG